RGLVDEYDAPAEVGHADRGGTSGGARADHNDVVVRHHSLHRVSELVDRDLDRLRYFAVVGRENADIRVVGRTRALHRDLHGEIYRHRLGDRLGRGELNLFARDAVAERPAEQIRHAQTYHRGGGWNEDAYVEVARRYRPGGPAVRQERQVVRQRSRH